MSGAAGRPPGPLTVGTAGHIDHGKTALVRALTGVDTDRLPEEKARGLTIALGYAPLRLPGGRSLSLVDVPGHERLIRTMVSGATGIDLFLLAIAADDGPMPQTYEHVRVLEALGVAGGVVAITKADRADPGPAAQAARELLPGAEVVACSARTGAGVADVASALGRVAAALTGRSASGDGAPVLHIDRVFTVRGAGTVVTGTLWSGAIAVGDALRLLPSDRAVRVRGVQVHDEPVEVAQAGQRVAVNLARLERTAAARGDVLVGLRADIIATYRVETVLALHAGLEDRERVQVHHGTRSVPARAVRLDGENRWQLRLEGPLVTAPGDRVVVRRIAPPDTLGGGTITAVGRRRSPGPPSPPVAPEPEPTPAPADLAPEKLALEARLRAAGREPPDVLELGADAEHLPALRAAGRAVRVGRSMYAHPDAVAAVRGVVEELIARDGSVTLATLRDALGTSRKYAQAFLEHLDATRVTRRLPDDRRVLRSRPGKNER